MHNDRNLEHQFENPGDGPHRPEHTEELFLVEMVPGSDTDTSAMRKSAESPDDQIGMVGPRRLVSRFSGTRDAIYSLCVMVTDWEQFKHWRQSFADGGFTKENSEVLTIDNTQGNTADAYVAANEFLQSATGKYIILVHHDVELVGSTRNDLDAVLNDLEILDPSWAICGNAGAQPRGFKVMKISHPMRELDVRGGPLPAKVLTLDENFLVVKRASNLAASRDLVGFHHYGTDLCLVADMLGWNVYVVDFLLRHNSMGTIDHRYDESMERTRQKWSVALRPRWIENVLHRPFYISSSRLASRAAGPARFVSKLVGRTPRSRELE